MLRIQYYAFACMFICCSGCAIQHKQTFQLILSNLCVEQWLIPSLVVIVSVVTYKLAQFVSLIFLTPPAVGAACSLLNQC